MKSVTGVIGRDGGVFAFIESVKCILWKIT